MRHLERRYVRPLHDIRRQTPTEEEAAATFKEYERNLSLRRFVGPLSEAPTDREPFTETWMPSPVFVIPKKQPNFWLEEALESAGNTEVLKQVMKKRMGWRFIEGAPRWFRETIGTKISVRFGT